MKLNIAKYQEFLINGGLWIDAERGLRIEVHHGRTGLRELRDMALGVAGDLEWSRPFHQLTDLRDAAVEMSANDVIRLGLMMRQPAHRTSGWLVYVISDEATHGMVRMLGHWSRTADRQRIFRNWLDAETWLERQCHRAPARFIGDGCEAFRVAG